MESFKEIETQVGSTLSKAVSAIEIEAPILEKKTEGFITLVYQWIIKNPFKSTAIISFIIGFILGTLV